MKCLNVRMFGMFDWRKGALCLLTIVALCAFTGSAADRPLPFDPLNPYGPPTQPDSSKYGAGTEPIMSFLQSFMAGKSELKFEEYNERIRNDDEDYKAYICRGFTRLTSLSENNEVFILVSKFGFRINDEYGTINFVPKSNFDFDEELRKNEGIDAACEKALPVMEAALADFEKVPKNWAGTVDFTNDLDETVSFDYADTLVARAAISEMISVLYFMKGYNTVAADMTTKPIDLEALAEAQRWMKRAAELVNAFAIAEDARTDYYKNYFFNLDPSATGVLRENARNLVDVSHWTVRIDLVSLSPFFFLNGADQTEWKKSKRATLNRISTLDVTLRNVFEGKLSAGNGTFPVLCRGYPLVDMSLPDPTFAGTFPGISRTTLAELLSALADEEVLRNLPSGPSEEIAYYGVIPA